MKTIAATLAVAAFMLLMYAPAEGQSRRNTGNTREGTPPASSGSTNRGSERSPQPTPPPPQPAPHPSPAPQPTPTPAPRPDPTPVYLPPPVIIDAPSMPPPAEAPVVITVPVTVPPYASVELEDCVAQPDQSGFDFSSAEIVSNTDRSADLFYRAYRMYVQTDTDIQELGAERLRDVISIPPGGWSATHSVLLRPDHVYAVRTWDSDCFLLKVREATATYAMFDWTFYGPYSKDIGPDGKLSSRFGK